MNLHQLRVFLTVAQSLTLTRASKRLGLAQPSVSNQLAGLESSIGTRLFERGHNRMVLTDAGQVLLRHAQSILREVDEAEAVLREFAVGKRVIVRVAGLNSVIKALLPNALISCDGSSGMEVDIEEASPGEASSMSTSMPEEPSQLMSALGSSALITELSPATRTMTRFPTANSRNTASASSTSLRMLCACRRSTCPASVRTCLLYTSP